MFERQLLFSILALSLLAAQLHAADDLNSPGLRAFCERLLNVSANATPGGAANPNDSFAVVIITNATLGAKHNETLAKLLGANASVGRMEAAGLPSAQAHDLLDIAWQWYDGQTAVERSAGKPDYAFSIQKVSEIAAIEQSSFSLSDELKALGNRIAGADPAADLNSTKKLFDEAKQEFADGRLDNAKALINRAYDEVSAAEAAAVHSRTMVESTRKNIESFLAENWKAILAAIAGALIFFFLFQKHIRRFLAKARLKSLLHEREVVEAMLKALQKDYFGKKNVTELTYHIKTKQYGDVIRNINRQLPLLREEIKKI